MTSVGWIYRARARQTLTLFTDRGIAYTVRVNDIPMTTGHGDPIQTLFAFEDNEHIVSVLCHDPRCLPEPGNTPQTAPHSVQAMLHGEPGQAAGNGNGEAAGFPHRRTPSP